MVQLLPKAKPILHSLFYACSSRRSPVIICSAWEHFNTEGLHKTCVCNTIIDSPRRIGLAFFFYFSAYLYLFCVFNPFHPKGSPLMIKIVWRQNKIFKCHLTLIGGKVPIIFILAIYNTFQILRSWPVFRDRLQKLCS